LVLEVESGIGSGIYTGIRSGVDFGIYTGSVAVIIIVQKHLTKALQCRTGTKYPSANRWFHVLVLVSAGRTMD